MNPFVKSTVQLINLHGQTCTFKSVSEPTYDIETGSAVSTETSVTAKAYAKGVTASQFKFPNLIGRELAQFCVAYASLTSLLKPKDKILMGSDEFVVESVEEHRARGELVLLVALGVKS